MSGLASRRLFDLDEPKGLKDSRIGPRLDGDPRGRDRRRCDGASTGVPFQAPSPLRSVPPFAGRHRHLLCPPNYRTRDPPKCFMFPVSVMVLVMIRLWRGSAASWGGRGRRALVLQDPAILGSRRSVAMGCMPSDGPREHRVACSMSRLASVDRADFSALFWVLMMLYRREGADPGDAPALRR